MLKSGDVTSVTTGTRTMLIKFPTTHADGSASNSTLSAANSFLFSKGRQLLYAIMVPSGFPV